MIAELVLPRVFTSLARAIERPLPWTACLRINEGQFFPMLSNSLPSAVQVEP